MIAINRCIYAGYSSQDFDLKTCLSFGGDSGETDTFINREAVASESYRGDFNRVHSYKYTDVLAPTISFIKADFSDFTQEEVRRVFRWLTSKDTASFLTIYHDDSEVISYEILGAFIEIQTYKLGNGRIVGLQATFESISPFAFSSLYTITKNVSNPADSTITINLSTDDLQSPVYPRITIKQNSSTSIVEINHAMTDNDQWLEGTVYHYGAGNMYYWIDAKGEKHNSSTNTSGLATTSVAVTNLHTDSNKVARKFTTTVKNNIKGETVVLDGANRVVSSSSNRIFGDDYSWNWLPLYEGENSLSFIGNCTVTIEYRTPIKCGEF